MELSYYTSNFIYKPILKFYLKFNTYTTFNGIKVKVFKGVFHPRLFFSSSYLYDYLSTLPLKEKSFLEIGSGSGLLSLLAYQKAAKVSALDVDEKAVKNTSHNFVLNFGETHGASIIQSDLFENLVPQQFDTIVINPPYFFKKIEHSSQLAWYCGANGEYFQSLFKDLSKYMHSNTLVLMILADNCEIDRIKNMAKQYHFEFNLLEQKKIKWEMNYIYQILFQAY